MSETTPSFAKRRQMMVDTQVRPSDVTKFPIIDAFLRVPREEFVPQDLRDAAYVGEHLPLSDDRVLLDPRVFAKMLDALDVQNSDLVLDVGCGFGYSSAVIGQIAEAVVSLEDDASLVKEASATTQEIGADNVAIIEGPLHEGAAAHGPYDAVILQGGVEEIPTALLDQIKDGGRIIAIFMEGAVGSVRLGIKSAQRVSWRSDFDATAPRLPGFNKSVAFSL